MHRSLRNLEKFSLLMKYYIIFFLWFSTMQDDLLILHVKNSYDSVLDVPLKTEFLSLLSKKYKEKFGRDFTLNFSDG